MPRGKSKSPQDSFDEHGLTYNRRAQKGDEWGGFVQVSLDEAHREEYDLWLSEAGPNVWRELDDALGVGLKLSVSYDGSNQCYIGSLTGRPDVGGARAFTCSLSARGGTFEEAVAVLIYKHASLLHYDWWDAVNEPKRARFVFG
jgi:hypothetical protein